MWLFPRHLVDVVDNLPSGWECREVGKWEIGLLSLFKRDAVVVCYVGEDGVGALHGRDVGLLEDFSLAGWESG